MTHDREGLVKYELRFAAAPPPPAPLVAELEAWRAVCRRLGFIGRDPARYGGLGFGNISRRVAPWEAPPHARAFVISGTQTGGLPALTPRHYTTVTGCAPERNRIVAEGTVEPSSEAMTHAAVYAQDDAVRGVVHAHGPEIWRRAGALGIPVTGRTVPYGTPEMAAEVARLFRETDVRKGRLFAMGGHEDGLVAFGVTLEEAVGVLRQALETARALPPDGT